MRCIPVVLFSLLLGCVERPNIAASAEHVSDAKLYGNLAGQVVWEGAIPQVPPLYFQPVLPELFLKERRANPNAPRGLSGAVVYLEGVPADDARAWDHAPVCLEMRNRDLVVRQGDIADRVGFARLGDPVSMVSRDGEIHLLRGRGADYFTLAFPEPDRELRRTPRQTGLIELSSAAGFYWMRGYLFVSDHPYLARCDAEGRFQLPRVPTGRYTLACWHPNWEVSRFEREPETGNVARVYFKDPFVFRRDVEIATGPDTIVQFPIHP